MSRSSPRTSTRPGESGIPRCPACGEPIRTLPPEGRCSLCNHPIAAVPVTAEDTTPYGTSRPWLTMCRWVFGAGSQRLAYLSLIRRSAHSARFVRWSLLVFSAAAALVALSQLGWHRVTTDPALTSEIRTQPIGRGWIHVISRQPDRPLRPGRLTPTAVWWNLTQSAIGVFGAFIAALFLGWFLLATVGFGAERSLSERFRGQGRFRAALRYGSAWVVFVFAGAVVLLFVPLGHVGTVRGWSFAPHPNGVYLAAAIVGSIGLFMGWFWLIRLAATAPPATRARVVLYFVLGAPLLAVVSLAGAGIGLYYGFRTLVPDLNLQW